LKRYVAARGIVADATTVAERLVTDPALPTPPAMPPVSVRPVPAPVLRLLATDDDLACVDDLCVPAGAPDGLGVADAGTPLDVLEPA
jgi:hypothetical protein